MRVDRGITGRASQVLVLAVRNVEVSLGVTVFLGKTEVDHVDLVSSLADAHEEVVGLDVSMNEGLGVDVLDAGDELISQEEDSLEGEFSVAEVEEVLQRRAEEIEDHCIVVTFCAKPTDEGNADTASEGLVDAGLVFELGVFGLDGFELDGNLFARDDVGAQVDITKTAAADLAADAVFVTDSKILDHSSVCMSSSCSQRRVSSCPSLKSGELGVLGRTMVVILSEVPYWQG